MRRFNIYDRVLEISVMPFDISMACFETTISKFIVCRISITIIYDVFRNIYDAFRNIDEAFDVPTPLFKTSITLFGIFGGDLLVTM